jgi:hypothetical protein
MIMSKELKAADVVVIFYEVEGHYSYKTEHIHGNSVSEETILNWLQHRHDNVVTIIKIFR